MAEKTYFIGADVLERFMADVFVGVGVPPEDARVCAEVLIASDKRGIDSHGIGRLKPVYYDRIKEGIQQPITRFEIVREGPTTALVDGHDGMGQVIGKKSMELAISKAREFGMGMVAARNSTHYGIAGYYAMMAAEAGMIGVTGTNARPSIAPTFGVENMLGTNPLTFAMPTDEAFPFVMDAATSTIQRGKVEIYDRINKEMPPGWVIGEDGKTRTDAHQTLDDLMTGKAALTPLGGIGEDLAGYKGYGYATVVEILSAALQSGPFLKALLGVDAQGKHHPYHLGHFFIAIDVSRFVELATFRKNAGNILRELRASKKAPGQARIYTAGEKEYLAWQARQVTGIPVIPPLQKNIRDLIGELGLKGYNFPF